MSPARSRGRSDKADSLAFFFLQLEGPVIDRKVIDLLKIAIPTDKDSTECERCRGDPEIILVQRKPLLLTCKFDLCVMVACFFRHWLARDDSKELRCLFC